MKTDDRKCLGIIYQCIAHNFSTLGVVLVGSREMRKKCKIRASPFLWYGDKPFEMGVNGWKWQIGSLNNFENI